MTQSLVARGRIVAVHPDHAVTIECDTACPGCRCGRSFAASQRTVRLPIAESAAAEIGTALEIRIRASELLRSSLWLYGVPWTMLVAGTALGAAIGRGDLGPAVGAILGLAAGILIVKRLAELVPLPHIDADATE